MSVRPGSGFPDALLVERVAEKARIRTAVVASMLREEFEILAEEARVTQFIDVLARHRRLHAI